MSGALDEAHRHSLSYPDVINDNENGTGNYGGAEGDKLEFAAAAFETAFGIEPAQVNEQLWRYRKRVLSEVQVEVPALPAARQGHPTSAP